MVKAIGFDVGSTLINYKNPLNWQTLYRPALEKAARDCHITLPESGIQTAIEILTKYNTRINYREVEVTSDRIFGEILQKWNLDTDLNALKAGFYAFFHAGAQPYPEAAGVLKELKKKGIKTGILTDVAYGMDNVFSLKDIEELSEFIDIALTSVDVGWRKPNSAGYTKLLDYFGVSPEEMLFVGDEEKDIIGANRLGIVSVLINRTGDRREFGQDYTVNSLSPLVSFCLYS